MGLTWRAALDLQYRYNEDKRVAGLPKLARLIRVRVVTRWFSALADGSMETLDVLTFAARRGVIGKIFIAFRKAIKDL